MKRFFAYLVVCLLSVMLSACGFQLRGTQTAQIDIKDMSVSAGDRYGSLAKELKSRLTQAGVNIHDDAIYKLHVAPKTDQRNISLASSTRGSEVEKVLELGYQIYGSGNLLLVENSVETRAVFVHDTNNIVGTEVEEDRLDTRMRLDAIELLMLRLESISAEHLEKLQAAADEQLQLKKEAERLEAKALQERRKKLTETIPLDLIEEFNQK